MLINLAADAPADFSAYARVCEVVDGDEAGKARRTRALARVSRGRLRAGIAPAVDLIEDAMNDTLRMASRS